MARSPGFWAYTLQLDAQLRLGFLRLPYTVNPPQKCKSLTHYKRYAVTLKGSHRLYVHGFRFYFTPHRGFFSPFPHGTGSLSVSQEYLALEDGPHIQTGCHVSRPTRFHIKVVFVYGAITLYRRPFQDRSTNFQDA